MSVTTERTPTSSYLAAIRSPGLGRYAGETRPSDVESPMCATARQDVRNWPLAAALAPGVRLALGSACGVLTTVLETGIRSEPSDSIEPTREPALAWTAPDSPAIATATTPTAPAAPASSPGLARPRLGHRSALRTRAKARPIAPWRIGSSINSHDRAASSMDAAVCSPANERPGFTLACD